MALRMPEAAPPEATRVAVFVGPTASGKSALAVELARRIGAEIVSADSQQVYRGFDVGTAKPTPEQMAGVPHHLVSVVDPVAEMNAGTYVQLASEAIAGIAGRGRLPLIVGGTGLYVRALLLGVAPMPHPDPEIRLRLAADLREHGAESMRERLRAIDPVSAEQILRGDAVKLLRALEIHELTGEAPSQVKARHGFGRFHYRAWVYGIAPPREELYRRIDQRTKAMFEAGLVDEVRQLRAKGHAQAVPMRSLGYRHAMAYLQGDVDLDEAVRTACRDTRHYAKRQLTWFRAEPWVRWMGWPVDVDEISKQVASLAHGD
jgi:tRNA dimethylallyltransferase